jgi:AraC-like DNA-binding protein
MKYLLSIKTHIPRECREQFLSVDPRESNLRSKWGIQLAGISELTGNYVINRKNPSFIILLCVLEGEGEYYRDNQVHPMKAGDIYIERANSHQFYWAVTDWKILWFHLEKDIWDSLCRSKEKSHLPEQIVSLQKITETYIQENQSGSSSIKNYLGELLHALIKRITIHSQQENSDTREHAKISKIRDSVNGNPGHPWTVEELASQAGVSPSYLYKITAKVEKRTPMEIVRQQRINLACQLLSQSDYPLKFIADRIGYTTPYAFSKFFRKETGISPGAYRGSL